MEKIAILVDSGSDVPKNIAAERGIYILPLKIIYNDRVYSDGVDITPTEVYQNLVNEVPKTSLPSGQDVLDTLDKIKADGFTHVICVTLSSGLSGTNGIVNLIANDYEGLTISVIDSKNIAIGSGFLGLLAYDLVKEGLSFDEVSKKVADSTTNSKVFFCVNTLEYLQKGGRIGLVSAVLGTKLNLKPIISCNDDGVYYSVSKVIGRKQSIKKVMDLATKFVGDNKKYNLCISHGDALEESISLKEEILKLLPNAQNVYEGEISPSLGVHTGPGLLGICVQIL